MFIFNHGVTPWFNSDEPFKVAYLQKLDNQSMLNDVLVIEIVSNSFS